LLAGVGSCLQARRSHPSTRERSELSFAVPIRPLATETYPTEADVDEAAWETLYRTRRRAFLAPETGKIAVKVINHYGDEMMKVYDVPAM
jgi:hypothetical protein